MPTVFSKNGFRFFFYSADWSEPIHVFEYGDANAKFWMKPIQLASSHRMKATDLKKARVLIEEHKDFIVDSWNDYFGKKSQ